MGSEKIWCLGNPAQIKFNCMPVVGDTHLKYLSMEAPHPLVLFPLTGWRIIFISSSYFLDLIHFSFLPRSEATTTETTTVTTMEARGGAAVEGGQRRHDGGGRPGTRRRWREARRATVVEGGQRLCDGGHHHGGLRQCDGGGRPGA
jgi:hypothetical protein